MKYYVAADSGGSKTHMVLYDEKYRIINSLIAPGTNCVFRSEDATRRFLGTSIRELIPDICRELDSADLCIMTYGNIFLDELKKICHVKSCSFHRESDVILASAGLEHGIVAQSGTGSAVMMVAPDRFMIKGGLGFLIGDEGSGFEIGAKAAKAALNAEEGHGNKTLLLDLIKEKYRLRTLRALTDIYRNADSVAEIASLSRIAVQAAESGDAVASEILESAAHELAKRVLACMTDTGITDLPIITSGGVWKENRIMFDCFCREIHELYPDAEIKKPNLEPVAGCIIRRKMVAGEYNRELLEILRDEFN